MAIIVQNCLQVLLSDLFWKICNVVRDATCVLSTHPMVVMMMVITSIIIITIIIIIIITIICH